MSTSYDFPYESYWYESYRRVSDFLRATDAAASRHFESRIDQLRIRPDFSDKFLGAYLPASTRRRLADLMAALGKDEIEMHEFLQFGRGVVHDHPACNEFQSRLVNDVSDLLGEPVLASYNFLSLYNNLGVCELHMDAPPATWTLDCCIAQSGPWPIYLSPVQPWPRSPDDFAAGWPERVKSSIPFREVIMEPGDALLFAGSSQWHYRERIPRAQRDNFCHMAFFHFIPEGCADLVNPEDWAGTMGIDAIAGLIVDTNT